jgi:iron complex outermembrane receptor protein
MRLPSLLMGTVATLALLPHPTIGQEASDSTRLGDIIVTARKREESIQTVPVAVSAISPQELEQGFTPDLRDIAGRVPSLVVDIVTAGPSAAAISIRGISFEDIEKSFDPAVGVVVDGVFIGTNTGQLLDAFDLQSLEVLRGPQGTLFGRNTIGGVINVRRTKPTGELGVKASVGYSKFDTVQGRLVANLPKFGDIVALKGFFYYDKTDGFYRNVTKNTREVNYRTWSAGATALITPTDNIEATLTYEHMNERGETTATALSETGRDVICLALPIGPGGSIVRPFAPASNCDRTSLPFRGSYTTFTNTPAPVRNNTDSVTAEIKIDLGAANLTSVTGYRRNKEDVSQDFDGTSINFFDTRRRQTYKQLSQEVRLDGNISESISGVVGGYYFDSNYILLQNTTFGPGVLAPTPVGLRQDVDHNVKSYAAFADIDIKLTDHFSLNTGARYTKDKKDILNNFGRVAALVSLSLPNWNGECVGVVGLLAPGVPRYGSATNCDGAKSFDKFTFRAGANYKTDAGQLLYASFSRGFRSGGFNGRAASPTSLGPYEPETVDSFEIGLKSDWLDQRLRTNFAVYHTNYKNAQEEVVQPTPPGSANPQETVVRNASKKKITGFEAELLAKPVDKFTLTASLAYINARYSSFLNDINGDNIPDDVSGLEPRRAPKYTFSIAGNYEQEIGSGKLDLNASFRYVDEYYTSIVRDSRAATRGVVINDSRSLADAREVLDAAISYTIKAGATETRFTVFGRNLLNDRGVSSVLPVAGLFTFGGARPPRTFGGEVQVTF